jgi:hypothetical protein
MGIAKKITASMLLAFLFSCFAGTSFAALVNGSFDNGFASWQGQMLGSDQDGNTLVSDLPTPTADQFTIADHVATLKTDAVCWQLTLFQDFQATPLQSVNDKLSLSFWLKWNPSAADTDLFSVTLGSSGLLDEYSEGISAGKKFQFDLTPQAGQSLSLAFSIGDFDFQPDSLEVADVRLTRQAPVPLPPAFLLFGSGLLGVCFARRNR